MRKRYAHLIWRRRDPRHYRFPLPNAVWDYKLKPLEFVVFSYLCYCGAHGQAVDLTPEVVADGVHLSVDTTRKYLDGLVGRGLITTEGTLSPNLQHTGTEKFFTLPNEIFLLKLPSSAFMVYAYLLLIENRRTHNCHPSYNTIAAAAGMAKNTAMKSISALLEMGLITMDHSQYIDKRGMKWKGNNLYTLKVCRTIHRKDGGGLTAGDTKTNTGVRKIVLPSSTATVLRERKKCALTEWIFPNPLKPEQPIDPNSAYQRLKILLKQAGLPSIRFHDAPVIIGVNQKPEQLGVDFVLLF